jgi:hypothetical protein
MRCVGSMNPPCERCAKAKRQCVITSRDRTHPQHVQGRLGSPQAYHNGYRRTADRSRSNDGLFDQASQHVHSRTLSSSGAERDAVIVHRPSTSSQASNIDHRDSASEARRLELPSVYSVSPLTSADLESAYLRDTPVEHNSSSSRSPLSASTTSLSNHKEGASLTAIERDIYHLVDL